MLFQAEFNVESTTFAGEEDAWLDEAEMDIKGHLARDKLGERQLQEARRMRQRVRMPKDTTK